jgi:hypothetical protein
MDNPEKLATYGTQAKKNKAQTQQHYIQYLLVHTIEWCVCMCIEYHSWFKIW